MDSKAKDFSLCNIRQALDKLKQESQARVRTLVPPGRRIVWYPTCGRKPIIGISDRGATHRQINFVNALTGKGRRIYVGFDTIAVEKADKSDWFHFIGSGFSHKEWADYDWPEYVWSERLFGRSIHLDAQKVIDQALASMPKEAAR